MIWYLWICYALWLSRFWWFNFSYCSQFLKWHGLDLQKTQQSLLQIWLERTQLKKTKSVCFFTLDLFANKRKRSPALAKTPISRPMSPLECWSAETACCREEHLWSVWAKAISRKSVFCLCHNRSELLEETILESYGITIWWIKHGRWVGNHPSSSARETTRQGFC